jgi:hypothetical protein
VAYSPSGAPVDLHLPFEGSWLTERTPAHKVPSHGTHLLGLTYAFDFVAVDERGRTAAVTDWRTLLTVEPPDRFVGFGKAVLAPARARVVVVHDRESDHGARRSPLTLLPYAVTQGARLRDGAGAVAGNHLVLALLDQPAFVLLAHLKRGSIGVSVGDQVEVGDPLAACGNSGNSTEPHLHLQAMDSADATQATGLPIAFVDYTVGPAGTTDRARVARGVPALREIVRAGAHQA